MKHNRLAVEAAIAKLELQVENMAHNLQGVQNLITSLKGVLAEEHSDAAPLETSGVEEAPAGSGKDFSKWLLEGRWYNKRNFALAVFQRYVNGQYTLAELQRLFAVDEVYPGSVRGNKVVFKLAAEVAQEQDNRFHREVIVTKDGQKIRVTNQIGMSTFPRLMEYLSGLFHFPVQGKGQNPRLWE